MSSVLVSLLLAATAIPPAPAFAPGDTADTIHGTRIADPYRALEDAADPKVQAWSDAQNERTRAYLDALPGRAGVAAKLAAMIKQGSPAYSGLQARGGSVFALYVDPLKQQPALVVLNAAADPASRRALLDPNTLDPSGHTEIDWFVASHDGRKVAVSLSRNGSEDGTLHVYDATTGREIAPPIDRVQYPTAGGALAWTADDDGFWYTRYPDASVPESERHVNQAAYLHQLGSPVAADRLVLGAKAGVPRTGEIFLDNSGAAAAAIASVQLGDGGQWQHYVLTADGAARQIGSYADRVIGGAVIDRAGNVYGVSRRDAPMGKVVKLAAGASGGFANAAVIVPESKTAAIIDAGEFTAPLVLAGDRLFVNRIAGGPSVVTATDLAGGQATTLALPPVSAVREIDPLPGGDILYAVASYLTPTYFLRLPAQGGAATRTALAMSSPISFADATVTRIVATSQDGTKVPVSIISRKGVKLDGTNPLLLYGYGGYGINLSPAFAGARARLWLDAGGIYAIANIRGGGEYGDAWHKQGMLTAKQNVFDDFDAAAETLIQRGYTSHARLALLGGSNGGLLMGAMITQHPGLARAVVAQVGIYDMIRSELDPNGAFNTSEYGSVQDAGQFKALLAYSPYHHVVAGTAYPAVLMMTGATDGRVNPMQSRKFTAALQAATRGGPVLLRTSKASGHGIGSSLDEVIGEATDWSTFLFDQLGMDASAAAR